MAEINRAAAALAREVADDDILVAGAVGPLGVRLEPFGPTSVDEARAAFREQLQALKDGGCDLFILETFADVHEIEQCARVAQAERTSAPEALRATSTSPIQGRSVPSAFASGAAGSAAAAPKPVAAAADAATCAG